MDEEQTPASQRPTNPSKSFIRKYWLILTAVILAGLMVGASLLYAATKNDATDFDAGQIVNKNGSATSQVPDKSFTADSIKAFDGKDGNKCYVAVNGTVYEIPQTGQWQRGNHLPSNGQAYCGADMSDTIGKSPHGTSKLNDLAKIGTFKN